MKKETTTLRNKEITRDRKKERHKETNNEINTGITK